MEPTAFTLCWQTSGIQNRETTHFFVFQQPSKQPSTSTKCPRPLDRPGELFLLTAPSTEPAHMPLKGLEVGGRMGPWMTRSQPTFCMQQENQIVAFTPRPPPGDPDRAPFPHPTDSEARGALYLWLPALLNIHEIQNGTVTQGGINPASLLHINRENRPSLARPISRRFRKYSKPLKEQGLFLLFICYHLL